MISFFLLCSVFILFFLLVLRIRMRTRFVTRLISNAETDQGRCCLWLCACFRGRKPRSHIAEVKSSNDLLV